MDRINQWTMDNGVTKGLRIHEISQVARELKNVSMES